MTLREVAELLEQNAVAHVEMAPIIPIETLLRRKRKQLTLGEAIRIAGVLGKPSKMPGYSYGLDAFRCERGSVMAAIPGSICSTCYARTDWYRTWRPLHVGHERRHVGLEHPQWEDAMVVQIRHFCVPRTEDEELAEAARRRRRGLPPARPREPFFRWHDSGDLQTLDGYEHLARIARVCERTPEVKHWLPTREYEKVAAFLARGGVIPPNLTIRLSALMIDAEPPRALEGVPLRPGDVVIPPELYHLPTSTAHTPGVPLPVQGKGCIQCAADKHTKYECQKCRACWDQRVRNVSYAQH